MMIPNTFLGPGGRFHLVYSAVPDGGHRLAETSFANLEIRIGSMSRPETLPETLIHELVHVAEEAAKLGLKESQVTALAYGLANYLTQLGLLPETLTIGSADASR